LNIYDPLQISPEARSFNVPFEVDTTTPELPLGRRASRPERGDLSERPGVWAVRGYSGRSSLPRELRAFTSHPSIAADPWLHGPPSASYNRIQRGGASKLESRAGL
jgi:hypothetical protein